MDIVASVIEPDDKACNCYNIGMKIIISRSAAETENFGYKVGKGLARNKIITLKGPLGSGKTTFVKGLARGLGIKKPITSPTFSLIKSYPHGIGRTRRTLYHIDLYRLRNKQAKIMIREHINDEPEGILVIEWPERISEMISLKPDIAIVFSHGHNGQRKIKY